MVDEDIGPTGSVAAILDRNTMAVFSGETLSDISKPAQLFSEYQIPIFHPLIAWFDDDVESQYRIIAGNK